MPGSCGMAGRNWPPTVAVDSTKPDIPSISGLCKFITHRRHGPTEQAISIVPNSVLHGWIPTWSSCLVR